ncbi:hypothetical protein KSP40_PGU003840 [Platanthera guangdongensis]|uniref:SOSEKI DIX-like domain-containing protein n=1 Tax=Platanthera guangdongensis TaxID=2320717 RepID=A0ABR2N2S3_9ASPA
MPSLFSWSCKRSYKNGYVWNDLSENDVIYPADGAEYVLKGSELIHAPAPPLMEDKQYFSGSIVEATAVSDRAAADPALKKSSSYNEERGAKLGMEEDEAEVSGVGITGKCIPSRKRSSVKQQ